LKFGKKIYINLAVKIDLPVKNKCRDIYTVVYQLNFIKVITVLYFIKNNKLMISG